MLVSSIYSNQLTKGVKALLHFPREQMLKGGKYHKRFSQIHQPEASESKFTIASGY
jgi:hypothetical protein